MYVNPTRTDEGVVEKAEWDAITARILRDKNSGDQDHVPDMSVSYNGRDERAFSTAYYGLVRLPARTSLQVGYLSAEAWQSSAAHLDDDIYNFATSAQLRKKFLIKGVSMVGAKVLDRGWEAVLADGESGR